MECEVSSPPSQKFPICPFPKADQTGPPIPIPLLITFFFVAYVF